MGFPVRVMVMSERKRLPATFWATLRADRTAERGEAMAGVVKKEQECCCSSQLALSRLAVMFGDAESKVKPPGR